MTGAYRCYPYLALTLFTVAAVDVAVAAGTVLSPGLMGAAVWLALTAVLSWWWLVCVASTVEVSRTAVRIEAPVGSASVLLSRVRSVRPTPGLPGAAVVRIDGCLPRIVALRPGWAPVVARLSGHPCTNAYDS